MVAWFCLLPYIGFWLYGLTDLDEGFYGAVVTDMLRRQDWITPTYNGVPWFEKPILSYWLAMPLVSVWPASEFAARLPSVLCTLGTAFVLFRFAKKHFGIEAARLTALVYTGSLLVVALGRMMMTDPALVLCLTLAFTTFYDSLAESKPNLKLVTAAMLGLGVLAKGPVALVLFGLIVAIAYWRLPDLRPQFKGPWLLGTAILLAIVATWYVPAYLANKDTFIQKFLIEQNIGRFQGGDVAHTVPWYLNGPYYIVIAALAFAPWIVSAYKSGVHKLNFGSGNPHHLRVYLWIWALVVLGFFTLSKTKLPHYALPAIAPLALLIAESVVHRHPSRKPFKFWFTVSAAWSAFVLVLANVAFFGYWSKSFSEIQAIAKSLRGKPEPVAIMWSINHKTPEIKLSLDQTSHPSFFFYYGRTATFVDSPDQTPPGGYLVMPDASDQSLPDGFTKQPLPSTDEPKTHHYLLLKRNP